MPFSNYSDLQAAVASWTMRDDIPVTDFIALTEAEIARVLRREVVRTTLAIPANVTEIALPADCAELRSLRFLSDTYGTWLLDIGTPEQVADAFQPTAHIPTVAAVVDNVLVFNRETSDALTAEIVYYQTLTPLSGGNPSNTLLANAPDAYLFGALREAAQYLEWDERFQLWDARFQKALSDEETRRQNAEFGASLTPARLPVVF